MRNLCALIILAMLLVQPTYADTPWPEFRGPRGDGIAENAKLAVSWSESSNVSWKTAIPGSGWSTPVIADGRIWMTSAKNDGHDLYAICVAEDRGKILHQVPLFEVDKPVGKNKLNSWASPSSVLAHGNVYVSFGTSGVACLNAATGQIEWKRQDVNLDHQEGAGSSIIVDENRLIFHCDGRDVQYLIALDAKTGDTVWKKQRSLDLSHVGDYARKAFSTPLIIQTKNGKRMISPAAQGCYCYDPVDGREIWQLSYKGFSAVPRPVALGELAYVVNTFAKPEIHAVRFEGKGDITKSNVVWKYGRNGPSTPSPIVVNGLLMFVSDKGVATCLDAKTGEEVWKQRLGGNYCASPIAANGFVYFMNREGQATVIKVARKYEAAAVNKLDDGLMSSPAVSGNALFLRTRTHLYRIEK